MCQQQVQSPPAAKILSLNLSTSSLPSLLAAQPGKPSASSLVKSPSKEHWTPTPGKKTTDPGVVSEMRLASQHFREAAIFPILPKSSGLSYRLTPSVDSGALSNVLCHQGLRALVLGTLGRISPEGIVSFLPATSHTIFPRTRSAVALPEQALCPRVSNDQSSA